MDIERNEGLFMVLLCCVLALVTNLLSSCGSAAQANLPVQTIPQQVTVTFDAHDGGTFYFGGCRRLPPSPPSTEHSMDEDGVTHDSSEPSAADCSAQVWLDLRSGGASSLSGQQGQDFDTRVQTQLEVPVSGSGAATTGGGARAGAATGAAP